MEDAGYPYWQCPKCGFGTYQEFYALEHEDECGTFTLEGRRP